MNNKPVAWTNGHGIFDIYVSDVCTIPLYTHPAKTLDRELLDKTIIDQQNEIKELRKNLDVALMIVNQPAKTLTDDEIVQIACDEFHGLIKKEERPAFIRFAKALIGKLK